MKALRPHEGFRMLATQNPSGGAFLGKRNKVPTATLSRFQTVSFESLPSNEWMEIVADRLKAYLPQTSDECLAPVAGSIMWLHQSLDRA